MKRSNYYLSTLTLIHKVALIGKKSKQNKTPYNRHFSHIL